MKPPSQKKLQSYTDYLAKFSGGGSAAETKTMPADYDFQAEAELVAQCRHGGIIHMDCERQRPPEIDYERT